MIGCVSSTTKISCKSASINADLFSTPKKSCPLFHYFQRMSDYQFMRKDTKNVWTTSLQTAMILFFLDGRSTRIYALFIQIVTSVIWKPTIFWLASPFSKWYLKPIQLQNLHCSSRARRKQRTFAFCGPKHFVSPAEQTGSMSPLIFFLPPIRWRTYWIGQEVKLKFS